MQRYVPLQIFVAVLSTGFIGGTIFNAARRSGLMNPVLIATPHRGPIPRALRRKRDFDWKNCSIRSVN